MQALRSLRLCSVLALVLGLALAGCSTTAAKKDPLSASDQGQFLTEKVKNYRNAYLRYSQAEEDARKDGLPEAVEQYSRAKANAKMEFEKAERALAAYEAEKGVKTTKTTP